MKIYLSETVYYDMEKEKLYKDTEELKLAKLRLRFIKILLEHKGNPVDKEKLIKNLYGADDYYTRRNLNRIRSLTGKQLVLWGLPADTIEYDKWNDEYWIRIYKIEEEKSETQEGRSESECQKNDDNLQEMERFESDFLQNSRKLIADWESGQKYEIEEDLLAGCIVKGQEYQNLYEYIKEEIVRKSRKNCMVQAAGGSGKTSSLVYTCKKFREDSDEIIPVFIQMRKLDDTLKKPLTSYLYQHYVQQMDFESPHDLEQQFLHNLGQFLVEKKKQLLVVLDGCNEIAANGMNGIKDLIALPNTMVVASSRLNDENLKDFQLVRLRALEKNSVERYLNRFHISPERNYVNDNLRLPFFVRMYVQICGDSQDIQGQMIGITGPAAMIGEWIGHELREDRKIHYLQDAQTEFTLRYFLPLLSMAMFFDLSAEEHVSLYVNKKNCLKALKVVSSILKDEELQTSIELETGWCIEELNLMKCLNEIVVKRFAFLKREENKENVLFSWTHECYRDWFIAKGMDVLRLHSDRLSQEYLTRFTEDIFRYPQVFQRKDYPSYSVAVYYAELAGEKVLTTTADVSYHKLIGNIAFVADDIGHAQNVLEYSKYIMMRDENEQIETPRFLKALTLSGLAYSMLHIYNVQEREDNDQIAQNAFEMLVEAKANFRELLGVSFESIETEIGTDVRDFMKLSPEEIEKFYKEKIDGESFENIGKAEIRELYDLGAALACLSRVYGNFGSYYLNRYHATKEVVMLRKAHKMHILGGLIKYYMLSNQIEDKMESRSISETMAISYRSMGIDLYLNKDYANSVAYFEYAGEYFDSSDDVTMVLETYRIRSKVADILENDSAAPLRELIQKEKEVALYFEKVRMFGELERILHVVTMMIDICRDGKQEEDSKKELLEFIDFLDEIFDKLSLENGLKTKMLDYWKYGTGHPWKKNYE